MLVLTMIELGRKLRNYTLGVVNIIKATTKTIQMDSDNDLNVTATMPVAPQAKISKLSEQLGKPSTPKFHYH